MSLPTDSGIECPSGVTARSLPRVLIAAPASGGGKTTVATGMMAALRLAGHQVAPFKVGPDYIDPGYHALAAGRPGRNLDSVMCGPQLIAPLLAHGFLTPCPADIAVVEGVMGLFDGRLGDGAGSSAEIARLTGTPVILVVDASHASLTHAAVVAGLASFDPDVTVAGVVLNRVSSARHGAEIRRGVEGLGIPVLGEIPVDREIFVPSRHLGLVPAAERDASAAQMETLAGLIVDHVDLDAVLEVASSAPDLAVRPWNPAEALRESDAWPVLEAVRGGSGVDAGAVSDDEATFHSPKGGHAPQESENRPYASEMFTHAAADASRGAAGGVCFPADGTRSGHSPLIAMASGRAFTFRYAETTELLEAAGCRIVEVDPLTDPALPHGVSGLYLGGGFPEMHVTELAANRSLHASIRRHIAAGMPVVAECAGLLVLCRTLDGHPMTGVLDLDAAMRPRLTMGYRDAAAGSDTLLARAGERAIGHEFHRTGITGEVLTPAWRFTMPDGTERLEGVSLDPAGTGRPTVHASYLHLHWAGQPGCAARFAAEAWRYSGCSTERATPSCCAPAPPNTEHEMALPGGDSPHPREGSLPLSNAAHGTAVEPDLLHHGDRDAASGLVDLAVNVRVDRTPPWLLDAITATSSSWSKYPDPDPARQALAGHHGVEPAMVLPTSGGAEGFVLLARALHPRHPVVIHPQFTEPEAALRAAGHEVDRLLLGAADGFHLDPAAVTGDADLVMVGNPTNPTGVLHPAEALKSLGRPGRVLVIDEAFMDATDGAQSLIGEDMEGLLVLRSLTKTYGLAGIRAGYVVGDPDLVALLAEQQPPWSVSTPAIAAMTACCSDAAEQHRMALAEALPGLREDLVGGLRKIGLTVIDSQAPFVLVDTSSIDSLRSIRGLLAERGFAVRRGETFPGLGPTWIRLAVRDPKTHSRLVEALGDLAASPEPQIPGSQDPQPNNPKENAR